MLAIVPAGALALGQSLVATAGSWERSGDTARFTPRFAAVPGTEYVVVGRVDDAGAGWRELGHIRVPEAGLVPSAVVETIDPGIDTVPANLLRFSVTFSSAMEEGSAAGRIQLFDETGTSMPGTLLEMPPELWDRGRRRLTALLEPGRIKRGLQPHVQAGAPLREGSTVTVVVDPEIRDASGARLQAGASRTYLVGAPIRSRVDPALWEVRWPSTDQNSLVVRFDRPLDSTLVRRYVRAVDGDGLRAPGATSLDRNALLWEFTPDVTLVDLRLWVDTRLEDLAGNSVRRVFDRDLSRVADDGIDTSEIILTR
ncbi:MAG TPA: hypothetical protein VGI56_01215 [Galbitalea sp.]